MKSVTVITLALATITLITAVVGWQFAQEDRGHSRPANQLKIAEGASQGPPAADPDSGEFANTAYFVDDIVEKLKSAVQELIAQDKVKTSAELRKDLDRAIYAVPLRDPFTTPLPAQELYQRATESVFLIAGLTKPKGDEKEWTTAFSTGFVVHEDGILSTCAHVFDHDDQDDGVVVMDVHGRIVPVVEILATDRMSDTCLFRIAATGLKPLPLGRDQPPGTPVRVIGHPGDSFFFFSAGHLSNYERDEDGLYWMNITADFGQGSSGGPVMDEAGNVIGQVSRTFTLYAGGDARRRNRRSMAETRQVDAAIVVEDNQQLAERDSSDPKKRADPQMTFKACSPVSQIRALIK